MKNHEIDSFIFHKLSILKKKYRKPTPQEEIDLILLVQKRMQVIRIKNQYSSEIKWASSLDCTVEQLYKILEDGEHALETLIFSHIGIAFSRTLYYKNFHSREDLSDMLQEAIAGLIDAAISFDPSRGACFSTHAWHKVRSTLGEMIINFSQFSRTSLMLCENKAFLSDSSSLIDERFHEILIDEISKLSSKQQYVVKRSFFDDEGNVTLKQISKELNVSYQSVQQYRNQALRKLKISVTQSSTFKTAKATASASHSRNSSQLNKNLRSTSKISYRDPCLSSFSSP